MAMTPTSPGILYCNCTYAQIIDPAVKAAVLRQLLDSGQSFEAVADLCEMSARKDPTLKRLACQPGVKIAACYPRAVKWLFASAAAPLDPAATEVVNMREAAAPDVIDRLFAGDLRPNVPAGKPVPATPAGEAQVQPAPAPARATSAEPAAS